MIDLEIPRRFRPLVAQARQVADEVMRPVSRRYDREEHARPKELDLLAAVVDGLDEGSAGSGGGPGAKVRSGEQRGPGAPVANRNGSNLSTALSIMETCRGDVGLTLSMPRQGLGNSAIASVADDQQLARYAGRWAAMAITEPEFGSDSAKVRTTAVLDEETDEYVLDGEKIYVTAGERADLVVVWATLDPAQGRAAIKSFVVERTNPGMELVRLERKLGIRASDTAAFSLRDCRVPKADLLGSPEIATRSGFGGAMKTFDATRPLVAAMAVGVARAALDHTRDALADAGVVASDTAPAMAQPAAAAELLSLEADLEVARLLTMRAAWMADNGTPNSLEASMAKAKAGRVGTDTCLRCIELCGALGLAEDELLEKWARDAKILDLFEGTQQIQLLIIARLVLGLTSAELR